MSYTIFVSYANGMKSHRQSSSNRCVVERQLDMILGEKEVLGLAESIILLNGKEEILNVAASTPAKLVKKQIKWPLCGAPVKVSKPVTTTMYMPEEVRDWLLEKGDGKVSRGFRKLIESANPELSSAWLRE
jgi:hypothetical protein